VNEPTRAGDPDIAGARSQGQRRTGRCGQLGSSGARALPLRKPLFVVKQLVGKIGVTVYLGHVEQIQDVLGFLPGGMRARLFIVVVGAFRSGNPPEHPAILVQNEDRALAKYSHVLASGDHAIDRTGQHRDEVRASGQGQTE